ncbi:MAG TPA: hypothetical protein V6D27_01050 [Vampirovibrionales bacterium]
MPVDPPNDQKRIQAIADSCRTEKQSKFTILVTDDGYWWALPDSPRHLNDQGDFLGCNADLAEWAIKFLLG